VSLDDLERAGVTLPRQEWGKRMIRSTINKPLFIVTAALAGGAVLLMYFGDGGVTTWVGAGLFLLALFGATSISLLAVSRQTDAGERGHASQNAKRRRRRRTPTA
jgi:hypothetical protein